MGIEIVFRAQARRDRRGGNRVQNAARVHGMFFLFVETGMKEGVGAVPAVVVSSSFLCATYLAACTPCASMTGPYRRGQIDIITLTSVPGCHGWRGGGHARCRTFGKLAAPCTLLLVVSGYTGILISVYRSCRVLYRWWFTGGSLLVFVCVSLPCSATLDQILLCTSCTSVAMRIQFISTAMRKTCPWPSP